jgi:hypothetical protein
VLVFIEFCSCYADNLAAIILSGKSGDNMDLLQLKAEIGESEWAMLRREEVQWLIARIEKLEGEFTNQIRSIMAEIEIREVVVNELLARNTRMENALHNIIKIADGQQFNGSHAHQMWQIAKDAVGAAQRSQ